jgi:hypothetical protein
VTLSTAIETVVLHSVILPPLKLGEYFYSP